MKTLNEGEHFPSCVLFCLVRKVCYIEKGCMSYIVWQSIGRGWLHSTLFNLLVIGLLQQLFEN